MKMSTRSTFIAGVFLATIVTGCATQKTVDMATSYNKAYEEHTISEAAKVKDKSEAIKNTMTYNCTDNSEACGVAKALSNIIAAQAIAGIQSQEFTLSKHKTDIDAQIEAFDTIAKGITPITMGVVAIKARSNDNGVVNNNAGGNIDNSQEENHATVIGDNSSSGTNRTNDTIVSEPITEEAVDNTSTE